MDAILINKDDLHKAITDYIVDSRTGDTLSYRETAALDVETAAQSSTDVLWSKLWETAVDVDYAEPGVRLLIAGDDIVYGQVLVLDDDGKTVRPYVGEITGDGTGDALPEIGAPADDPPQDSDPSEQLQGNGEFF